MKNVNTVNTEAPKSVKEGVTRAKTNQMHEAMAIDDIFWPLIQLNTEKETFGIVKAAFLALIKQQPAKSDVIVEALGKLSQVFLSSALNDKFIRRKLEDNYTIKENYKQAEKFDCDTYRSAQSIN